MDELKYEQIKTPDLETLGEQLRKIREVAQLSLSQLADKLNVTKGYLSRLERGNAKPSIKMIERIANLTSTDPDPLLVLTGYLPADIRNIFYSHPVEAPAVVREAFAPYVSSPERQMTFEEFLSPPTEVQKTAYSGIEIESLYKVVEADCFEWLESRADNSVHAVVTDPPYGLKEYSDKEKSKLRSGRGGVWRIPPSLDGYMRRPLPRFTILTDQEKDELQDFFARWAELIFRVLVPGGHVFIATNPLVSHFVYLPMIRAGFEKRGEIIRLVQTLRGGDRPKNAHDEFPSVTVMPRACWEPWGLFRKPCDGRVQDNLRKWKTGGLRRISDGKPFYDVIKSSPTRSIERDIAPHPSLKPQAFMRRIVHAALPLGEGIILDPFMGAGSTIAAACAVGYRSIGIEVDPEFYSMALKAIPQLAAIVPNSYKSG